MKATIVWLLLMAYLGQAQTSVDLRTQARNVDFSAAASTRPAKTGPSLPGICAVGEMYFLNSGTPGDNLYGCTAANTWTRQSTANALPSMAGQANKLLTTDGSNATWTTASGDVSGTPGAMTVTRLQGRLVAASAPTDGQTLAWNASLGQWQPSTTGMSPVTGQATIDFAMLCDGCCDSSTFLLSGAATADGVAAGWPPTLESGLIGMMRVSAANTIEVKLCNWSGISIDPVSQTFRAMLVR